MPKSFYLIDGHAHIYRAYFAPFRDLTGPNGEPTKATFVFTQMLLNLIEQRKPDYLAMVIDSGDETATRPSSARRSPRTTRPTARRRRTTFTRRSSGSSRSSATSASRSSPSPASRPTT
jgi:5'-3' exonuclease